MSHKEQTDFVKEVKCNFPDMFYNKSVLEIGSLNVNGTVRDMFNNCKYIGIDVVQGPEVDKVCWAHEHDGGPYDIIISCESLEHDPFWNKTLHKIPELLCNGGLVVITAAGPNRPEHGTLKTNPTSSGTCKTKYGNHYRNIDRYDLFKELKLYDGWDFEIRYERELWDVYLWAVKNGS